MERTMYGSRAHKIIVLGVCGAMAATLAMPVTQAHAATAADAQANADATLQQLISMQEVQDQKYNEYISALQDYQQAVTQRDEAAQHASDLQTQIADVQQKLGNRASQMYRDGSSSFLDVILGSASFDEFVTNWDTLTKINQNDANNIAEEKALKREAESTQALMQQKATEADQQSQTAAEAYNTAVEATNQLQAAYDAASAEAQAAFQQEMAAQYGVSASEPDNSTMNEAAAEYGATVNADGTVYDSNTGTTYSSAAAYASATGNDIVSRARAMIGSAYVWGGVGGSWGGFDCSGLVSYAITGSNTRLGTSGSMMGWQRVDTPQVGDIVTNEGHAEIVSEVVNGQITKVIQAQNYQTGVVETDFAGTMNGSYVVVRAPEY